MSYLDDEVIVPAPPDNNDEVIVPAGYSVSPDAAMQLWHMSQGTLPFPSEPMSYAEAQQRVLSRSMFPNIEAGLSQAGLSFLSMGSRATGIGDADAINRESGVLGQAADVVSAQDSIPDFLQRGVRGVAATVPVTTAGGVALGPYGAIGLAAASEMNQAITTGRDEGLSGSKLAAYTAVKGGIEGGIAAAFQMAGMGGAEKAFKPMATGTVKEITRQGIKNGLKEVVKDTGHELREEVATELSHLLADRAFLDSKTEITPAEVGTTVLDTVTQTIMTMGLMQGVGAGVSAIDRAANKESSVGTNSLVPELPVTPAAEADPNVAQKPGEGVILDAVQQEEGRMQGGPEGQVTPDQPSEATGGAEDVVAPTDAEASPVVPSAEAQAAARQSASFTADQLNKLKQKELKGLAKGLGIDLTGIKSKPEAIDAILAQTGSATELGQNAASISPDLAMDKPASGADVESSVSAPTEASVPEPAVVDQEPADAAEPIQPTQIYDTVSLNEASSSDNADIPDRKVTSNALPAWKAEQWLQDAVSRAPANLSPRGVAKWLAKGFGPDFYQKYLDQSGKSLVRAVMDLKSQPEAPASPVGDAIESPDLPVARKSEEQKQANLESIKAKGLAVGDTVWVPGKIGSVGTIASINPETGRGSVDLVSGGTVSGTDFQRHEKYTPAKSPEVTPSSAIEVVAESRGERERASREVRGNWDRINSNGFAVGDRVRIPSKQNATGEITSISESGVGVIGLANGDSIATNFQGVEKYVSESPTTTARDTKEVVPDKPAERVEGLDATVDELDAMLNDIFDEEEAKDAEQAKEQAEREVVAESIKQESKPAKPKKTLGTRGKPKQESTKEVSKPSAAGMSPEDSANEALLLRYYRERGFKAEFVEPADGHQKAATAFAESLGTKVYWVDTDAPMGGLGRKGVIVLKSDIKGEDATWGLVAHELAHSTGIDKLREVFDRTTVQARARDYVHQLRKTLPKLADQIFADDDLMYREGVARLVQKFMEDPKYRKEVVGVRPSVWRWITDQFRRIFPSLESHLTPDMKAARDLMREFQQAHEESLFSRDLPPWGKPVTVTPKQLGGFLESAQKNTSRNFVKTALETGWATDGRAMWAVTKADKTALSAYKVKKPSDTSAMDKDVLTKALNGGGKTKSANIIGFRPASKLLDTSALFAVEIEGEKAPRAYNAKYINAIRNRYDTSTMIAGDNGMLAFVANGKRVGAVMPMGEDFPVQLRGEVQPPAPLPPPPKPKPPIEDKAAQAREEARAAADAFIKAVRDQTKLRIGLDPEIARLAVTSIRAYVKAGIYTFAEYVKAIADAAPDMMRDLAPYIERAWEIARKRDTSGKMGDGSTVAQVLLWENEDGDIRGENQGAGEGDRGLGTRGDVGTDEGDAGVLEGESPGDVQATATAGTTEPVRDGTGAQLPDTDTNRSKPGGKPKRRGKDVSKRADHGARGRVGRGNYHLTDPEKIVGGGPKAKFARNVQALEIMDALTSENREPTPEELDTLAAYTGWGAFGQELFQGSWDRPQIKDGWQDENDLLRSLVTQEEWESIQRSIINAHYTDPETVTAMWDMARRMGFDGGRVLEPSMGVGNFFSMMPRDMMERSQLTGIELDRVSGGIAKILHPDANIQIKGYEQSQTPDNFYDLVISNVPFANVRIASPRYSKLRASVHNFFFAKAIDQVRPGGLVMFLTSNTTMDGKTGAGLVRKYIQDKGDLVSAIRFPSGAFQRYAGTKVVADLIVIRKRMPGETPNSPAWSNVEEVKTPNGKAITVNEYWKDHPENILGTMTWGHGTTSGRPGMIVDQPADLATALADAIKRVPEGIFDTSQVETRSVALKNDTANRQSTVVSKDGDLWVVQGEHLLPLMDMVKWKKKGEKPETSQTKFEQATALIKVRDALAEVMDVQRRGEDATVARKSLNDAYDAFVSDHGYINDVAISSVLAKAGDPLGVAVMELESPTADGKYEKRPIFTKDTTRSKPESVDLSVGDAYAVQRNESLDFDPERVSALAKVPVEQVIADLSAKDTIYKTPTGSWEAADRFLSGNVRRKARELRAAMEEGVEGLERSLKAVEDVTPEEVPYTDIELNIGATWIESPVYQQFIAGLLNADVDSVEVQRMPSSWSVRDQANVFSRPEATTTWGHPSINFRRIIEAAMNNTSVKITRKDSDGNVYTDEEATGEANAKVDEIREQFKSWLWSDPDRITSLSSVYNENFNSYVTPDYDGSHLTFQGLALEFGDDAFSFRKHQADAVWRGLLTGRGIYAHEVGTGKTFTMAGLAIESKRLGVAKKPVIFGHNANAASVAKDVQAAYPGARVLYVDNLADKEARLAQIALDDWDVVIIPHSLVDRLELRPETVEQLVKDEMDALEAAARDADSADTDGWGAALPDDLDSLSDKDIGKLKSPTAKELVKERLRLKERIERARGAAEKAGTVFFEDMGIDMLLVDEAHVFKKLPLATKQRVKGLQVTGSQRGTTMMMLADYVRGANGGRGVHLFTGTPITNTLNELYNMQRLVMAEVMERDGTKSWDGWFNNFAQAVSDMELTTGGTWDVVERLTAFINIPELRRTIGQYLDVVFADEMPEFAPRQDKDGRTENPVGRPYKLVHIETGEMTNDQAEVAADIRKRYEFFKSSPGKARREMLRGRDYNPIVLDGEGVKNALDPRFINPNASDSDPRLKINRMITRAMAHYHEDPLSTQMIFMQTGFGKKAKRTVRDAQGNKSIVSEDTFSFADAIKAKLIESGVSEDEIVVFSELDREGRADAARMMREGKVRFGIGSSESMGTGVNAQTNMIAMHHLDAPWMPGDFEQRNGRGHRQGNKWNTVHEYRYIAEGSHDARRWQVLLTKRRFIDAFMRNKNIGRVLEGDATDTSESGGDMFSDTFGAAAGDPRVMVKVKLTSDVKKLEAGARRHAANLQNSLHESNRRKKLLPQYERNLEILQKDIETLSANKGEQFEMVVEGKVYTDRTEATQALKDAGDRHTDPMGRTKIGEYRGLNLVVDRKYLQLESDPSYQYGVQFNVSSIDGVIRNLPGRVEKLQSDIENSRRFISQTVDLMDRPFPRQADLDRKRQRLAAVEAELQAFPDAAPGWVRNAAPLGTTVYINGVERDVAGYRGDEFVVVEGDNGEMVPYKLEEAFDAEGNPVFTRPSTDDFSLSPVEDDEEPTSEYAFQDPEVEREYQVGRKGLTKKSFREKLQEWWDAFVKVTTRGSLPELPRTEFYGEARSAIHGYLAAPPNASHEAKIILKNTTDSLNANQFDLFTRIVILRDLVETEGVKAFKFTDESAQEELDRLQVFVDNDQAVQDALDYRKSRTQRIIGDYVDAHAEIGIDVANKFTRENYFRHQVLEMYAMKNGLGGRGPMQANMGRGWLLKRKESELAINANYFQVEFEVLSQMISDTIRAKQIKRIADKYDVLPKLKRQTRDANYLAVVGGEANMNRLNQLKEQRRKATDPDAKAKLAAEIEKLDHSHPYRQEIAWRMDMAISNIPELKGLSDQKLFAALGKISKNKAHPMRTLAIGVLGAVARRKRFIKDYLGPNFKTWEDFVPDTHAIAAIRPGRSMFTAYTLPEQLANELLEGVLSSVQVSKEDMRRLVAMGGKYTPIVIPSPIHAQMEGIANAPGSHNDELVKRVMAVTRWGNRKWKRWVLLAPFRVTKYTLRNLSEIDKVLSMRPAAVLELKQSAIDLYEHFYKGKEASPLLKSWLMQGGIAQNQTINEITDINDATEFRRLVELSTTDRPRVMLRAWRKYWETVEKFTGVRESLLRYAAFRSWMKELAASNGQVRKYGASNKAEVDGIVGNEGKAARLSSDLLGAYEDVSVAGQTLRDSVVPFWSFQETNARTYLRGLYNVMTHDQASTRVGESMLKRMGKHSATPYVAYRVGQMAILLMGTKLVLDALNSLWMDDDDWDDIPADVRERPFLYLGRANGRVMYFDRLGTSTDVLDWLGLDHAESYYKEWLNGRTTPREIAERMTAQTANKSWDMVGPQIKAPVELYSGRKSLFGRTQRIRDRLEYVSSIFGLDPEYRLIKGRSVSGAQEYLKDRTQGTFVYSKDPGEAQYYLARDTKRDWMRRELGRQGGEGDITPRSQALYHYKRAIRFGDDSAALRYLGEYESAGGTKEGLEASLRALHPLAGLSVPDEMRYLITLTTQEQHDLDRAEQYVYQELMTPEQAEQLRSWRQGRMRKAVEGAATLKGRPEDPDEAAKWDRDREVMLKYIRSHRSDPDVADAIRSALTGKSMSDLRNMKGVPQFRKNKPFQEESARVMDFHKRRGAAMKFAEEFAVQP